MGHTVGSITLMGRAHTQILAECKEPLKPVLKEDIRTLCDKENSDSEDLFGENLLESMKEAKESFRISNSLPPNFKKLVTSQALTLLLGTQIMVLVPGFCFPFFKIPGPRKKPAVSRTVIQQH